MLTRTIKDNDRTRSEGNTQTKYTDTEYQRGTGEERGRRKPGEVTKGEREQYRQREPEGRT